MSAVRGPMGEAPALMGEARPPMSPARRRVVVVGHGMVGSRFVEELLDRAPEGHDVTVLGAEEYEPYNRVLLSEVVAGRIDIASIMLPAAPASDARTAGVGARTAGVSAAPWSPVNGDAPSTTTVHRGRTAIHLDRGARTVVDSRGDRHRYDVLVLATGAAARVPALAGLMPDESAPRTTPEPRADAAPAPAPPSGSHPSPDTDTDLLPGVHALRTLDDAREIVAAGLNAHRAVVLGGGVLGLEAACGLARRGLCVTLVHAGPHLMDRQLDPAAAEAVTHGLTALGVAQRTDAVAAEVVHGERGLVGLRLERSSAVPDGELLPADLLVLAVGTVPRTDLAAASGLAVSRGILVDEVCATADPAVFALGDCAEPPEGGSGLIAQGWAQARGLARLLAEGGRAPAAAVTPVRDPEERSPAPAPAPAPADHGNDVVRVKAYGLDVVAMGRCGSRRPPGGRTVRLSDPEAGRHVEVVVEGGVVVGATCVGAGAVAADLVTAYTRRTPAPTDPAQLLLRPVRGAAPGGGAEASPTLMPDRATVCRCNGVTKGDLVAAWRSGATSTEEIATATRATTGCGGCTEAVCGLVDWLRKSDPPAPSADAAAGPARSTPAGTGQRAAASAPAEPAAVRATRARGSFVP